MKQLPLFLLGLLVLGSCNEDPDMVQEVKPIPVVYAVINKYDSVNFIYLSRTFSGDPYGADINARIWDSLYFREVIVSADLIKSEDTINVSPVFETRKDKKPGTFNNPDYPVYVLYGDLTSFSFMYLNVNIPDYQPLRLRIPLINKSRMIYPKKEGTYVTILPDQAFVSQWEPYAYWSDQILKMTVSTKTTNGFYTDTLEFDDYAAARFDPDYSWGPVNKSSFTYGNLLSLLNRKLSFGPDVIWNRIDEFSIQIITSAKYFPIVPLGDLNLLPYDVLKRDAKGKLSALGIATSKTSIKVTGLKIDYNSREYMKTDTLLTKFKLR